MTTQPQIPNPVALVTRAGKGCAQYTFDTPEELAAWATRKPYRDEQLLVMPMHGRKFLGKEWMPAADAAAYVARLVGEARAIEDTARSLASMLLQQLERESEECAYWMVSALSKLSSAAPTMRVADVLLFVRTAMPGAAKAYAQYVADKS